MSDPALGVSDPPDCLSIKIMKNRFTLAVTLGLFAGSLFSALGQTGETQFHNAYGALNVRGAGHSALASFSLSSAEPGAASSVRPVYSASALTNVPLFANKVLYTVVPRLPSLNPGAMGEGGGTTGDFASYGLKTESSLLSLMSANFMAQTLRAVPGQEDNFARYYAETQQGGRNYYLTFGGNIDPTTGLMSGYDPTTGVLRLVNRDGRISMLIPTSLLAGMSRTGSPYLTRMGASALTMARAEAARLAHRNGGHRSSSLSEENTDSDFGAVSLRGDSDSLNVFTLTEADLQSAAAVSINAPRGSQVVIEVADGKKTPVSVSFGLGTETFPHEFLPPISGSLSGYNGGQGSGFGNSQLTTLTSVNPIPAGSSGGSGGSTATTSGGGGGFSSVSYVPEGKSVVLLFFGLLALAPLARKRSLA